MLILHAFMIIVTSAVIYLAGERFVNASQWMGKYYGLSESVRGATLDAISGSAPELSIALSSVIFFSQLDFGIGTIVGSALFNIILIPAVCVFVAPVAFKVDEKVIHRDGLFYILTLMVFLAAVFYSNKWSILVGLIFIGTYILYLVEVHRHGIEYYYEGKLEEVIKGEAEKKAVEKIEEKVGTSEFPSKEWFKEMGIFIGMLVIIIVAGYFFVDHSISLARAIGIPPIIIAFTVAAAATSFSDMVISVVNAKEGNITDASANVIGSNIFDILIGLGLPILLANLMNIPTKVSQSGMMLVFALLVSTVIVIYFFAENMKLTKPKAVVMLLIYAVLVAYVVLFI